MRRLLAGQTKIKVAWKDRSPMTRAGRGLALYRILGRCYRLVTRNLDNGLGTTSVLAVLRGTKECCRDETARARSTRTRVQLALSGRRGCVMRVARVDYGYKRVWPSRGGSRDGRPCYFSGCMALAELDRECDAGSSGKLPAM